MALLRFPPVSRAGQWSEAVRWIDPRTGQANDLTGATLTLGLYQAGRGYRDYGWRLPGPWDSFGVPVLAAQTRGDGTGSFVVLPGAPPTEARFFFGPTELAGLVPGNAMLLIWATVAGATDEIERQAVRVLDGPRALPAF